MLKQILTSSGEFILAISFDQCEQENPVAHLESVGDDLNEESDDDDDDAPAALWVVVLANGGLLQFIFPLLPGVGGCG